MIANTQPKTCKYCWDDVFYAIREAYAVYADDQSRHMRLAASRGLTVTNYLAARLTRSAQEAIDFAFQSNHNWNAIYQIVRSVCLDFEETSREEWSAQARRSKTSRRDLLAARITRYIGEAIDFNDYLAFNTMDDFTSNLNC